MHYFYHACIIQLTKENARTVNSYMRELGRDITGSKCSNVTFGFDFVMFNVIGRNYNALVDLYLFIIYTYHMESPIKS